MPERKWKRAQRLRCFAYRDKSRLPESALGNASQLLGLVFRRCDDERLGKQRRLIPSGPSHPRLVVAPALLT